MKKLALLLFVFALPFMVFAGGGDFPVMPPQDIPQDTIEGHPIPESTSEPQDISTDLTVAIVTTTGTVLAALIGAWAIIASNKRKRDEKSA